MIELNLEIDGRITSLALNGVIASAKAAGDPVIIRTLEGKAMTDEELTESAMRDKRTMSANAYVQGTSIRAYAEFSLPDSPIWIYHPIQFYRVEVAEDEHQKEHDRSFVSFAQG